MGTADQGSWQDEPTLREQALDVMKDVLSAARPRYWVAMCATSFWGIAVTLSRLVDSL